MTVRPLAIALLGLLAFGCAAPSEEEAGSQEGADSIDVLASKESAMNGALSKATLGVFEDVTVQGATQIVAGSLVSGDAQCSVRMNGAVPASGVRLVPKGDVYRFASRGAKLAFDREQDVYTWTLGLINVQTRAGQQGRPADFSLVCSASSTPIVGAKLDTLLSRGTLNARSRNVTYLGVVGAQ